MLYQWFLDFAQLGVLVFLGVLCVKKLKELFLVASGSVGKATDDGETLNLNANFYVWDSGARMAKKLGILQKLGDDRKSYWLKYYKDVFAKAEAENEADHAAKKGSLKPVG